MHEMLNMAMAFPKHIVLIWPGCNELLLPSEFVDNW
jgi:hypothetical protein